MSEELSGKVAFVAGASRGIGRHIAIALAEAGAQVAVAARSEAEQTLPGTIHTVAAEITEAGGDAVAVACDVRDEQSVDAAIGETIAAFGHLDIVVCNAGILWLEPTLQTPVDRWRKVVDTNLNGVFIVTRAALPHVMARPSGSLIAVTTAGVHMLDLGSNAYWVAKAGVERYYLGLAKELREHNIAVNCLAPKGVVPTEGWKAAGGDDIDVPDEHLEDPAAIARSAVFLADQDASGETGRVLYSLDLIEELARR